MTKAQQYMDRKGANHIIALLRACAHGELGAVMALADIPPGVHDKFPDSKCEVKYLSIYKRLYVSKFLSPPVHVNPTYNNALITCMLSYIYLTHSHLCTYILTYIHLSIFVLCVMFKNVAV